MVWGSRFVIVIVMYLVKAVVYFSMLRALGSLEVSRCVRVFQAEFGKVKDLLMRD